MSTRYSAARPKRASEEFARLHHLESSSSSGKKPKFDIRNPSALAPDAPEDDAILQADVIGSVGMGTKRGAVNIDGYDSDSENEGFDARAEDRARTKGKRSGETVCLEKAFEGLDGTKIPDEDGEIDQDEDMFADSDSGRDETGQNGKGKKKEVRFLEEDEIVGQVENSRPRGHISGNFSLDPNGELSTHAMDDQVSSDDEEDAVLNAIEEDVDEEVGAGGLKRNAPKVDAFNMKTEQEEGRFDEAGNYVRKAADPDAVHDEWLLGLSKKDMKKAAEAHERREAELRKKRQEDDSILVADVLRVLIQHLEKTETVLEALARLGKSQIRTKKIPKWKVKKNQKQTEHDSTSADAASSIENSEQVRIKEAIIAITGAADQLLTRGQMDIYDQEREMLIRQFRKEVGADWVDPPAKNTDQGEANTVKLEKMWEYRWTDGRDDNAKQGPFDGASMMAWSEAGYFRENVEFRREGDSGPWSRAVQFI